MDSAPPHSVPGLQLPRATARRRRRPHRRLPEGALPDDFHRKVAGRGIVLGYLLDLSRQQGAEIACALAAISAVQNEIDRRTS
ncbi:hypothetical protein [Streptomyces sp. NPDC058847]|uniref:hypothetical protein n=1 Tax=Streptomyces sp. NPDC058847 TaxID=3346649 RepID=UPI0036799FE8